MILHPDEGFRIILEDDANILSETIEVKNALGRISAKNIKANIDSPPFDKSAMDGYAYNSKDKSAEYKVIEIIPAGFTPKKAIGKGECSKIMTGAMIPNGADSVVRVEYTEENDDMMKIVKKDSRNIAYKGENLKNGDVLLQKGTFIRAQHIGILSAFGLSEIEVTKKPKVAVVTTGSELVEPGSTLDGSKIYDSNSPQLLAQIQSINAIAYNFGMVIDNFSHTIDFLEKAMNESDILLISGGVSKGDYDYVPEAIEILGIDIKFRKWLLKPGFPTLFGKKDGKYIFGLPGNPVSTFVVFEIFVKPLIFKLMGYDYKPEFLNGKLSENFTRKNSERVEFRPVLVEDGLIKLLKYNGSGHLNVLTEANGLLRIESGVNKLTKGESLSVRRI